jgi:hypothetical protein
MGSKVSEFNEKVYSGLDTVAVPSNSNGEVVSNPPAPVFHGGQCEYFHFSRLSCY